VPAKKKTALPTKEEMAVTTKRIRMELRYKRTFEERREDTLRIHALRPDLSLRGLAKEAAVSYEFVRAFMRKEDPQYVERCLSEDGDQKTKRRRSRKR